MAGDSLRSAEHVVEEGAASSLHTGAQLHVVLGDEVVADLASGEARPGLPMSTSTSLIWLCCTKPIVALAIGQLWERGALDIDDPVERFVPEFAKYEERKRRVRIRHLLTHTSGLRDTIVEAASAGDWDERLRLVCERPLAAGAEPGENACYSAWAGWMLLGEIIQRASGHRLADYVQANVFDALDMDHSSLVLTDEMLAGRVDTGPLYFTDTGRSVEAPLLDDPSSVGQCWPGLSGRGPMRELARVGQVLLHGGRWRGHPVVNATTAAALTAPHRTGLIDELFGRPLTWGFGFMTDPHVFGEVTSPWVFGHGGQESSLLLADRQHELVVAAIFNGMPSAPDAIRRRNDLVRAIYADLDLSRSASRPRPVDRALRPATAPPHPTATAPDTAPLMPRYVNDPLATTFAQEVAGKDDSELDEVLAGYGGVGAVLDALLEEKRGAIRPESDDSFTVVYEFLVDGRASPYALVVDQGVVVLHHEVVPNPDLLLRLSGLDYVRITVGELDNVSLLKAGRITFDGDLSRVVRMRELEVGLAFPASLQVVVRTRQGEA